MRVDQLARIFAEQGCYVAFFFNRLVIAELIPLPMSRVGKVINLAE